MTTHTEIYCVTHYDDANGVAGKNISHHWFATSDEAYAYDDDCAKRGVSTIVGSEYAPHDPQRLVEWLKARQGK